MRLDEKSMKFEFKIFQIAVGFSKFIARVLDFNLILIIKELPDLRLDMLVQTLKLSAEKLPRSLFLEYLKVTM